jgi:hypothetical protein
MHFFFTRTDVGAVGATDSLVQSVRWIEPDCRDDRPGLPLTIGSPGLPLYIYIYIYIYIERERERERDGEEVQAKEHVHWQKKTFVSLKLITCSFWSIWQTGFRERISILSTTAGTSNASSAAMCWLAALARRDACLDHACS